MPHLRTPKGRLSIYSHFIFTVFSFARHNVGYSALRGVRIVVKVNATTHIRFTITITAS
jgi:hypothetical protein